MSNLDKVRTKIAALMARAKDKASSEAEANKAMKVAQKLMAEHSLTLDDITAGRVNKSDYVKKTATDMVTMIDRLCGMAIGRFCDVKAYINHVEGGRVEFYGYGVDVELAFYLREVMNNTAQYEFERYFKGLKSLIKGTPVTGESLLMDFCGGFSERIKERMEQLKGVSVSDNPGKALVVLKMALVEAAFADEEGMELKDGAEQSWNYTRAEEAGRRAADKVKFNRSIGGHNLKRIK
ncbi:hypothetical protein PHIM7_273 [Sinorhizobium phage phiM7]|uniref:Uncharacterized protein n=1 Tax=Sinorhizobium phage phiM7 TaxID=1647403 RepID=A0A0F6SIP6_9CAUD|nr:hypothetical protein FDH46_gp205 [Sinorhizobium phage phiM7]AKF12818.1 hypothetical protein PHIM7_273 [Sinorhizobium phage phiM7]